MFIEELLPVVRIHSLKKINCLKSYVHQDAIIDGTKVSVGAVYVGKRKACEEYIRQNGSTRGANPDLVAA